RLFTPSALKIGSLSHHLLIEIARCSHAVKLHVSGTMGSPLTVHPGAPGDDAYASPLTLSFPTRRR
ncbi:MAG: hypothetical protein AAB385_00745, partial [Planctomycetota bacterium]